MKSQKDNPSQNKFKVFKSYLYSKFEDFTRKRIFEHPKRLCNPQIDNEAWGTQRSDDNLVYLPAESPVWNCLQTLKSYLSGRLARYTRVEASGVRPVRWQNDAAFFEADLRYVLTMTPLSVELSESGFYHMNQLAHNLLLSLNDMVNPLVIKLARQRPEQEPDLLNKYSREYSHVGAHNFRTFDRQYPLLKSLIDFLNSTPGQFNLVSGSGLLLFTFPLGQAGHIPMDRMAKWKQFLEQTVTSIQSSQDARSAPLQQVESPPLDSIQEQPYLQQRLTSLLADAILQEFRHYGCGLAHEVRLRVPDKWENGAHNSVLNTFFSCCLDGNSWQEAECGLFQVMVDGANKSDICAAIERARCSRQKLYLFVNQRGLFDVSDKVPSTSSLFDELTMQSLGELLDQKTFSQITFSDYMENRVTERFDSQKKGEIALALARCLMDFVDKDLDLASYSWNPERVFFLRSSGGRTLYMSLKAKNSPPLSQDLLSTIRPGNPILLSFAKLLLEIHGGEKMPMVVHHEDRANLQQWAHICDFVDSAERDFGGNYLSAVKGCLYLHLALPRNRDRDKTTAASELLRKAIYEQVVRNLELAVKPHISKRKRRDSLVDELPLAKKLSISPCATASDSSEQAARPKNRHEFDVAIICALPLEYDAMSLLVDQFWDGINYYGKADGDPNIYTYARIGKFNVVLVLSNMGKVNAGSASSSLRSSYPGLKLVLLTGICGGVPRPEKVGELLLGDIVISSDIIQHDFGKQYPDGFLPKETVGNGTGTLSRSVRNLLDIFKTKHSHHLLKQAVTKHLQHIQNAASDQDTYTYPGTARDKLFLPDYRHKHHNPHQCLCANQDTTNMHVCDESRRLSCDDLGCDDRYLVTRKRLEVKSRLEGAGRNIEAQDPSIFIGPIGSGDTVFKSGEDRDRIAQRLGVLAFEMEGAGVRNEIPCIVVKAICDYADSHKNDTWQNFAAATAAAATKSLLEWFS